MNNAKQIAEKILNQKYVNQLEVSGLDVNTLARNYLDTINELETDNTYISMLEKRMIELNNSNQELKSEIIKLKEENERLNEEVKFFPSLTEQRNLHEQVTMLKKSRDVLRKAVEYYGDKIIGHAPYGKIEMLEHGEKAREAMQADNEIFADKV